MTGKFHIANISASAATYYVNDTRVGTSARPMNAATGVPDFVTVLRSREPDPSGTFAVGANAFSVRFEDTIPPEPARIDYDIVIPDGESLDDDLYLYVFRDSAMLLSSRGVVLSNVS
ncbi:hypothetical protein [Burkholderia plantarii]|uniref:hypothetical protein n=1 Tax=Burkholderia plantarii TaxID=41899 RepID=UPI0005AF1521|nr:hypothetical protein [Burkholderia plantarii]ALK33152.1 hypothetical protein bpln_2g09010 [Burkholderia plantarii]WLE62213.1 hypothetical protein GIY62_32995 [Burkholderia plantarii]GLZ23032.1 hypothetical protein Bpla01_65610 [Burkholderia plantarii]